MINKQEASPYKLSIGALAETGTYDPDYVAFHAVFQCLCDHIEKEKGGLQKYREYVEWCFAEDVNDPEIGKLNLELYEWYKGVDWDEVYDLYGEHEGLVPHGQLEKAIEVMGSWWD